MEFVSKEVKGEVVPVYTLRAYMGSGDIAPFILNLSTNGSEH
jgi:hypothetical protein